MDSIAEYLQRQIMILDGAMGTKIQSLGLSADDYHRGRFSQWPVPLAGNNDILSLTAPDVIAGIHRLYVNAGADIISTNTFSSNRISQRDYCCEDIASEMALEGARIARRVADEQPSGERGRKIWVAGSMGPTSKSLTLASDMSNPAMRSVSFDEMASAYGEQAEALIDGGADMLLLETCFDALNTKSALYAIERLNERRGLQIPVMVSVTVNDRSGRTLTGQTLDAFFTSIAHYPHLLSFGLNCSFGVTDLHTFVEQLAGRVPVFISLHPNAGLPNEMGEYDEQPHYTATHLRQMADAGLLNIAGGCCGTDERHIEAISKALRGVKPRQVPQADSLMHLSGLETLTLAGNNDGEASSAFVNIGERTNVAGSRKFARLIAEKKYDEALAVARHQIEGGASIIDINMDDAMLNSSEQMETFCRYVSNDPAIARAVLMIDSSDWATVVAGLKNAQGKCIVNSISLKNSEQDFLSKARELKRLGAAVVVMAFDEQGQATTFERKTAIAQRAYRLLTGIGFPPQDIIFDVNILAVATGISEHQAYASDFIRAVEWIKQNLPLAKTSGGVSNLSFSFRGNNRVREAMHSVFLYHAIAKGLDMAIVNPAMLQVYDDIDPQLLRAVEDVILNSDDQATERLITLASAFAGAGSGDVQQTDKAESWRSKSVEQRLAYALTKGTGEHLADDVPEALQKYGRPIAVIEQPLMQAMKHIGQLFAEGKMFLPQVVKSAQVMKDAVALLQPYIDKEEPESKPQAKPCVVLATANGDVHDIGKNIVGIVLACNGFQVTDLGVMVANEAILEAAQKLNPLLVGVSGLITPSLKEMEKLCLLFQREGMNTPIIVGGATTSALHTAVRLAPLYDGLVAYGGDASQTSVLAKRLEIDPEALTAEVRGQQELLRSAYENHHTELTTYEEANRHAPHYETTGPQDGGNAAKAGGRRQISPQQLIPLIDWRMFLLFWGFKGETLQQQLVNQQAEQTLSEGKQYLERAVCDGSLRVRSLLSLEPATRRGNDIVLQRDGQLIPMLRSQNPSARFQCLADFFDTETASNIGMFIVTADSTKPQADDHDRLMSHALCARLAEAGAEWLQKQCYGQSHVLRAAFGYAACPDHSLKRIVFDRLDAEQQLGITLTDHYSIKPSTTVCGIFISHPEARYFTVGRIDRAQLSDYCRRRGISEEEGELLLNLKE